NLGGKFRCSDAAIETVAGCARRGCPVLLGTLLLASPFAVRTIDYRGHLEVRPGYHCPEAESRRAASPGVPGSHWNPSAPSAIGSTSPATLSQVSGVNPHSNSHKPRPRMIA